MCQFLLKALVIHIYSGEKQEEVKNKSKRSFSTCTTISIGDIKAIRKQQVTVLHAMVLSGLGEI